MVLSPLESYLSLLLHPQDFPSLLLPLLNTVVIDSNVQLITGILWKLSLLPQLTEVIYKHIDGIVHSVQTYLSHTGIQRNCLGILLNVALKGKEFITISINININININIIIIINININPLINPSIYPFSIHF